MLSVPASRNALIANHSSATTSTVSSTNCVVRGDPDTAVGEQGHHEDERRAQGGLREPGVRRRCPGRAGRRCRRRRPGRGCSSPARTPSPWSSRPSGRYRARTPSRSTGTSSRSPAPPGSAHGSTVRPGPPGSRSPPAPGEPLRRRTRRADRPTPPASTPVPSRQIPIAVDEPIPSVFRRRLRPRDRDSAAVVIIEPRRHRPQPAMSAATFHPQTQRGADRFRSSVYSTVRVRRWMPQLPAAGPGGNQTSTMSSLIQLPMSAAHPLSQGLDVIQLTRSFADRSTGTPRRWPGPAAPVTWKV